MLPDRKLQEAVLAELAWEPSVQAAHIGVTANAGTVTLTGRVESFAEKHAVQEAAWRVKGVVAVAEEIEVQVPFERQKGDNDIAAAAVERLAWDVAIPPDSIKVSVEHGWITLAGEVTWFYQKHAAEQDVHRLSGVTGVSNQILVRPSTNIVRMSDDIMHALHRSWLFDAQTIKVVADGGHIRLTGTARTPHDRQLAAATAWATPGVLAVENDITLA